MTEVRRKKVKHIEKEHPIFKSLDDGIYYTHDNNICTENLRVHLSVLQELKRH